MLPPSSENEPLLPKTPSSTLNQDVESSSTSHSMIFDASPQEEGSVQEFGGIRAELKLFLALLVDSVPSKSAFTNRKKVNFTDKYEQ